MWGPQQLVCTIRMYGSRAHTHTYEECSYASIPHRNMVRDNLMEPTWGPVDQGAEGIVSVKGLDLSWRVSWDGERVTSNANPWEVPLTRTSPLGQKQVKSFNISLGLRVRSAKMFSMHTHWCASCMDPPLVFCSFSSSFSLIWPEKWFLIFLEREKHVSHGSNWI